MFAWACLELVINNMIKTKIAIMYLLFKKKLAKKDFVLCGRVRGQKFIKKFRRLLWMAP